VYYNKQEQRSNKRESRRMRCETRGSAPPVKLLENIKLIQKRESALWSGEELDLDEMLGDLERPQESGEEKSSPSKLANSQSPPSNSPTSSNAPSHVAPSPAPAPVTYSPPSLPLPDFAYPIKPIAQPTYKRGFAAPLVPTQRPASQPSVSQATSPMNVASSPMQCGLSLSSSPRRFDDLPFLHSNELVSSDERMEQDWAVENAPEDWQEREDAEYADEGDGVPHVAGEGIDAAHAQHVPIPSGANPKLNVKVPHIIQPRMAVHTLSGSSPVGSLIARKKRASTASDLKLTAEELQQLLSAAQRKKDLKEAATVDSPTGQHSQWQESHKSDEAKERIEREKESALAGSRDRAQGRSGQLIGARPNRAASSETASVKVIIPRQANNPSPSNTTPSPSNMAPSLTNSSNPSTSNSSHSQTSAIPSSGLGTNPRKVMAGGPIAIPQSVSGEHHYAPNSPSTTQQSMFSNVFRGTDNFLEFQKLQAMQVAQGQAKPIPSPMVASTPIAPTQLTPLRYAVLST
jgi:hypothetical protein